MKGAMRPRERVLCALNHTEPDRVPIDLAATSVSGITLEAYANIRSYLGMAPDPRPRLSHLHQGIYFPREDLLTHYGVDFRTVQMKRSPRGHLAVPLGQDSFRDEYGITWKKSAYDYAPVTAPLQEATISDLRQAVWPDPSDKARVEGVREEARRLREGTDFAVVADIIDRGPFELAVKLRGYTQFLTDLYADPSFAVALLDKITETNIALWSIYLEAVGEYADVVCQGDDVGMQTSLIISPEMYRSFIKPCHRRIFEFIHSRSQAKIFLHSCGSIYDIIPDLIEIGVDILNPIQRTAAHMDIDRLKREFGRRLSFWGGGVDTQNFLPQASLEDIETEVRRTIEAMAPGGGYVFVPTHNIQPDITAERLNTVYATALKYR
jgi:uroporphyrinogen decarboxylase